MVVIGDEPLGKVSQPIKLNWQESMDFWYTASSNLIAGRFPFMYGMGRGARGMGVGPLFVLSASGF